MTSARSAPVPGGADITFRVGPDELIIRQRYETLSIANDVASGLLFLIGSILFFGDATMYAATWLFVIGSVLMLIRPCIRLTRRFHLRSLHAGSGASAHETSMDF